MRDELAERLLSRVMGWKSTELQEFVPDLQALALMKYDEYGHYGPGIKFVENLAGWLDQFPSEQRQAALEFVMKELVFISSGEMSHLVSLVPSEIIVPVIRERVAADADIRPFRITEIEAHATFRILMRSSLIIGASDGARLGELRRASATLSHEQFVQGAEPDLGQVRRLAVKLAAVLRQSGDEDSDDSEKPLDASPKTDLLAPFQHIFFVDDFSGSGRTLLRQDPNEPWDGKVIRLRDHLEKAAAEGLVVPNAPVTIVLYFASEKARKHLEESLSAAGLDSWSVKVVAELPSEMRVDCTNDAVTGLCHALVDPTTKDEHKGLAPLGYSACALPLVLSHNTPNNSICLLWMDTREKTDSNSTNLKALFPRYERHHEDRR